MGGAVKSVAKAVGIADKPKPAPAPTPTPTPAVEAPKATKAQTEAALQRQAAFRARRGSGASLIGYGRTLGDQSPLQGEDIA